jgi:hypothetical protein
VFILGRNKPAAPTLAALAALALTGLAAPAARAADEEIQVYMEDMDAPGTFGLDVHTNYVATGDATPDSPLDGQSPLHRTRVTPEWSYGLSKTVELGLYLPLTTFEADGRTQAAGIKGRIKWIAPRAEGQDWFWGLNLEVGRVNHTLDVNPWNAELKGIWGLHKGKWTLAANANLDWTISGPNPQPASLDVDVKLAYTVAKGVDLGVESYNGLGPVKHPGHFGEEDQTAYAAADLTLGKWALNLGVGHGYGGNRDGLVLKAIVSVPMP